MRLLTYYTKSLILDLMDAVREARLSRGLSQRKLAARSGLSFRGIQLLEAPGHDPRMSSLAKVAEALTLPPTGIGTLLDTFFRQEADSFRSASMLMSSDDFTSWPIHLFNAVDTLRRSPDVRLVAAPPVPGLDQRLQVLVASTVETLCDELSLATPSWCRGIDTLPQPWFVAGVETLKTSALIESPAQFRQRNIFVLANFLKRA